jgi:DUF971 family protein
MSDADATRADTIDVDRANGLTVVFGDGHSCFFANDELRRNCPCASCRDLRNAGEEAWPRDGAPATIQAVNAELVGNWGISFAWSDGHATGIFPFDSLRSWCEERELSPEGS